MRISLAQPNDVYGIRVVQRETWLDTYPNVEYGITQEDVASRFAEDDTAEGKQRIEGHKERLENPNMRIWVAKDGEQVVGYCWVARGETENTIQAIYVLPEYQGRGLGHQLLSAGLEWLGGRKPVVVHVVSYNQSAIGFYQRHGFVTTGKTVQDDVAVFPSGAVMPEIEMIRSKKEGVH